jgi:hypothetical protein
MSLRAIKTCVVLCTTTSVSVGVINCPAITRINVPGTDMLEQVTWEAMWCGLFGLLATTVKYYNLHKILDSGPYQEHVTN